MTELFLVGACAKANLGVAQRGCFVFSGFLGRPEIVDFGGVWGAPGGRETLPKGWGGEAPHLLGGSPDPPGPPRPPDSAIPGRPKNPKIRCTH